jgi:hypothetical protein
MDGDMRDETERNVGQNVEQDFELLETLFGVDFAFGFVPFVFPGLIFYWSEFSVEQSVLSQRKRRTVARNPISKGTFFLYSSVW